MWPADRPLLVLFGGAGREGIVEHLLARGMTIGAALVPTRARDRLEDSIARLAEYGLTVERVSRESLAECLAGRRKRTLLSIGFPYLIAPESIARFDHALNVHPTLLPKYRGPTTAAYIILNGEREAGSTVHLLDAGMDTGPIVAQSSAPTTRFDTIRSLQQRVYALEPALVAEALDRLADPTFTPAPQDEARASVYPRPRTPADSEIDPSRPLSDLFDAIRACDPDDFPAFFMVDGEKVFVRLWREGRDGL